MQILLIAFLIIVIFFTKLLGHISYIDLIQNIDCTIEIVVVSMIASIPVETILNTHHYITCCVHLHIDTNSI